MRMNRTLAYGLACLQYLGANNGGQWNQVADIARFQGLPAPYCNKVLQALVHAGFVASQKGRGYRLTRDLGDISVWALMEAFTFNGAPAPEREEIPGKLYKKLREEVNHWLVGLTVQDIIEILNEEERQKAGRGRGRSASGGAAEE
jgi:Rrf2 family protein